MIRNICKARGSMRGVNDDPPGSVTQDRELLDVLVPICEAESQEYRRPSLSDIGGELGYSSGLGESTVAPQSGASHRIFLFSTATNRIGWY